MTHFLPAKTLVMLVTISLVVGLLVGLTGCGHMFKLPPNDEEARLIVEQLNRTNNGMSQFKGLANIQMSSQGRAQSGRIAFAAIRPNKMRIELLNMWGTPLTSLSGDGETISILNHGDHKHYRLKQKPKALETLVQIPIGIEDLMILLAGGVPLPPHVSRQLQLTTSTDAHGHNILLKNRWNSIVAKLKVDRDENRIQSLQVIDPQGVLQYRIQWDQWQKAGAYVVPSQLIIESPAMQKLTLTMDRFWPNATVAPSTFVLDLSKK